MRACRQSAGFRRGPGGHRNCDTVQRARRALDRAGLDDRFHDFRADGLSPRRAQRWIDALGLVPVLNRRGTIWRGLAPADPARAEDAEAAALLAADPGLVKRPLFDRDGALRVGVPARSEAEVLTWLTRA